MHNWRVELVAYVFVVHVFAMTGHEPVSSIHCTVQYVCDVSDARMLV